MKASIIFAAACVVLILSNPAFAQTENASLGGTVMDASRGVLPGAYIISSTLGGNRILVGNLRLSF